MNGSLIEQVFTDHLNELFDESEVALVFDDKMATCVHYSPIFSHSQ